MSLLVDIEKDLGSFHLKVAFEAGDETLALLGASGCGKSLTLRCIAGIEKPDRGRIVLNGVTLFDSDKKINLTPQERHTGLLFQNYALFPNMTVAQNIAAGAKREKDPEKRKKAIAEVMESFGIAELSGRYPHQLSGGQQQRVALARILVSDPHILLLDEPFSALDSHLRFRLEQEVRQVIERFGKTVLLVSHDRDEVYRMSDSIAIMHNGNMEVIGSKDEVFAAPRTRNGAILTGCKNISAIEPLGGGQIWATDWDMALTIPRGCGSMCAVALRAHDIVPGVGENSFRCQIVGEIENPFSYTLMLKPLGSVGDTPILWEVDKSAARPKGEVTVNISPKALIPLYE